MKKLIFALFLLCAIPASLLAKTEAEYKGGQAAVTQFIMQNLRYPVEAAENGIEGRVVVSFTVNSDGSTSDFKILRSVDPSLEAEALRVAKSMTDWVPATDDNGNPVKSVYTLPFSFRLQ